MLQNPEEENPLPDPMESGWSQVPLPCMFYIIGVELLERFFLFSFIRIDVKRKIYGRK